MRRFLFIFAVLSVFCASCPPCWKAMFGVAAKILVRTQMGCRLAYRQLSVEGGNLVFDDLILFDVAEGRSAFSLQAERIALTLRWPLEFLLNVQKPRLTVTREALKRIRAEQGTLQWQATISEGLLEWIDEAIEPARFSFDRLGGNDIGNLHVSWEKSFLHLGGTRDKQGIQWHIEGQKLPLALLQQLAQVFGFERDIEVQGSLSGAADLFAAQGKTFLTALQMEGTNLYVRENQISCAGKVSLDWQPDHVRLSVEQGMFSTASSSLEEVSILATYRAGVGAKWECQSIAKNKGTSMPFACVGKGFFDPDHPTSIGGQWELGATHGRFSAEDPDHRQWLFEWDHLKREEAALLQGFIAPIIPRAEQVQWCAGTLGGKLKCSQESVELLSLEGEGLHLKDLQTGIDLGCQSLFANPTEWGLKGGWIEGLWKGSDWKGRCDLSTGTLRLEGLLEEKPARIQMQREGNLFAAAGLVEEFLQLEIKGQFEPGFIHFASLEGQCGASHFSGRGNIDMRQKTAWQFTLQVPQFEGEIEPWLYQWEKGLIGTQGRVRAQENGFEMRGNWTHSFNIEEWSLALHWSQGVIPLTSFCYVQDLQVDLYADAETMDFVSARGMLAASVAGTTVEIPWDSPRIKIAGESALFDVRMQGKLCDLARIAGRKEGSEVWIDPSHSHFFGVPFVARDVRWSEGSVAKGCLKASIPWFKISPLFTEWDIPLEGVLNVEGAFERGKQVDLAISGLQWTELGLSHPLDLCVQAQGSDWRIDSFTWGPLFARSKLELDASLLRFKEGEVRWEQSISSAFEGKWSGGRKADFVLKGLEANLGRLSDLSFGDLQGALAGQGCISLSKEGCELDLDAHLSGVEMQGFSFQNAGPLHLYFSSPKGALVKGIDCRISKEEREFRGKADLVEFDAKRSRWALQKAQIHLPVAILKQWESVSFLRWLDDGQEIDVTCDLDSSLDGSEVYCSLKEGFFSVAGAVRHVRDLHFFSNPKEYAGNALLAHQGKWAKISIETDRSPASRGRLLLQEEEEETPLAIHWTLDERGDLALQSLEGSFAGIEASFHSLGRELIGSARFDFRRLCEWIPPSIAEVFQELEMGQGYELKGRLQMAPSIHFQGIFSGKQLELFGYELRTLLAQVDLTPSSLRIYDVKISDSAGSMKLDQILIQGSEDKPWTIEIPKLIIEDLRPSLLHRPGEEVGELTPLLVRRLTITGFQGLLDEGKTYRAEGNLTFINSFKRGKSVFDIPSDVFGRIIGLDLELLIPVTGELLFEIKDGFVELTQLKNAFSEGTRSEFFLVDSDPPPRMDLDGNLEILVKMKQFVLFTLTEGFFISIEGKLNNPQFRLQKKKRFFPIGS